MTETTTTETTTAAETERLALAHELALHRRRAESEAAVCTAAVDQRRAAVDAARETLAAAERELAAATSAAWSSSLAGDRAAGQIARRLDELAAPLLADARARAKETEEGLRAKPARYTTDLDRAVAAGLAVARERLAALAVRPFPDDLVEAMAAALADDLAAGALAPPEPGPPRMPAAAAELRDELYGRQHELLDGLHYEGMPPTRIERIERVQLALLAGLRECQALVGRPDGDPEVAAAVARVRDTVAAAEAR